VFLALLALVGIPTLLLNTAWFQQKMVNAVTKDFSERTGATLTVYKSEISLFRGVEFHVVKVRDSLNRPILSAEKISAGVRIIPLFQNRVELDFIRLIRANIYLSRKTPDSPLNIQSIIDAFQNPKKKESVWNIDLSSVVLRNCQLHYDVTTKPVLSDAIDFNHLYINNISAKLGFRAAPKKRYAFWISKLQAVDKCGLRIDQLKLEGKLSEKGFSLKNVQFKSGNSTVTIDRLEAKYKNLKALSHFADSVLFGPTTIRMSVVPADFACLETRFSGFDKPIDLLAKLQGRLSDLFCKELSVNMQNSILLNGKFGAKGLTDMRNLSINGSISQLRVNPAGMDFIVSHLTNKDIDVSVLHNLGTINYSGLVKTIEHRWILTGDFSTAAGDIETDIRLGKSGSQFLYEGRIKSQAFQINKLLSKNVDLGEAAFDVSINAVSQPGQGLSGKVDGQASHIQFRGYDFKNLTMKGQFDKNGFEGEANLGDANGNLHFLGLVNFTKEMPVYKFDLYADGFNPFALGLLGYNSEGLFSFHLHSDFEGHNLDDLTGKLTLDSLNLNNKGEHFFLKNLDLEITKTAEKQQIIVSSPLINGELWGTFQLSSMAKGIKGILSSYFPSLVQSDFSALHGNYYNFNFTMAPSPELTKLLGLPVNWNETASIQGLYNEKTGKFRFKGDCPSMTYGKTPIESAGFLVENPQKEAKIIVFAQMGNGEKQMKINLDVRGLDDFASIKFNMSNSTIKTYSGDIQGDINFTRNNDGLLQIAANLKPSSLIVNDSLWQIHPTTIKWADRSLFIEDFQLTHSSQFIKIQGITSEKASDTLNISLNSFSLDDMFLLLPTTNTNVLLGGRVSGDIQCVNLLKDPSMDANLTVEQFSFNHAPIGNLTAKSEWNKNLKALALDAVIHSDSVVGEPRKVIALAKGVYAPSIDSLYLGIDANHLSIAFLEPYLGKVLYKTGGLASGKISITGPMKHLAVYADAYLENATFGVKMLNTRYTFTDSIHVTPHLIYFRNIKIRDRDGNTAIANGFIRHKYFKEMRTSIDVVGTNILAMDLPANPSAYFYGTAYGTGTVSINGPQSDISIDVNMKTEEKTNVTISFLDNSEVTEAGFIHFAQKEKVNGDDSDEENFPKKRQPQPITTPTNVTVNLQIEATPVADLTLITDPSSGDEIRAKGSGALRAVISEASDIQLFGRYNIESGSYKFIYENLLRRDFTIENGGSITFSGNPFAAQLDVKANYTVNARLTDLLTTEELSSLSLNRSSIPVNCVLKLTGELQKPSIKLDLAYPSADDELKRRITNVINTEDMLNQEIVFLMLFGRFSTPTYSTTQSTASNNMSTVWNTGISTLSSQLNKMINNVFGQTKMTFDFNYKNSTYDATTPGEWGVVMSGRFFDNRLSINSNIGSRENLVQGGSNQFIGEFDGNLKFKNSEKWSWKFFNKANDSRYFKSALNTQGIGIVYKENYNSLSELFRKMLNNLRKLSKKEKK
jgi:hypothetical protein